MDRYLKRSSDSSAKGAKDAKKPRQWGTAEPRTIVAWNCNSLSSRLGNKADRDELLAFIKVWKPDVFFLSEVRAAAYAYNFGAKKGDGSKRARSKLADSDSAVLINAFLREPELADYHAYFSLADWKYAGTAALVNTTKVAQPIGRRYNIDIEKTPLTHDTDGRVMFMEWESFALLHTYSPNNGWKDTFSRRADWDSRMKSFLSMQRSEGKKVIWCGDLNCSPTDADLSHPEFFKRQRQVPRRREAKTDIAPENIGQPGCTPGERSRFQAILNEGGMVDFYRRCHLPPADDVDIGEPVFTWRGGPGKYFKHGMRIDHFVGAESLVSRIEAVKIFGRGFDREREGSGFFGSDHCPVILQIAQKKP